jgi:hypothetical protein
MPRRFYNLLIELEQAVLSALDLLGPRSFDVGLEVLGYAGIPGRFEGKRRLGFGGTRTRSRKTGSLGFVKGFGDVRGGSAGRLALRGRVRDRGLVLVARAKADGPQRLWGEEPFEGAYARLGEAIEGEVNRAAFFDLHPRPSGFVDLIAGQEVRDQLIQSRSVPD